MNESEPVAFLPESIFKLHTRTHTTEHSALPRGWGSWPHVLEAVRRQCAFPIHSTPTFSSFMVFWPPACLEEGHPFGPFKGLGETR